MSSCGMPRLSVMSLTMCVGANGLTSTISREVGGECAAVHPPPLLVYVLAYLLTPGRLGGGATPALLTYPQRIVRHWLTKVEKVRNAVTCDSSPFATSACFAASPEPPGRASFLMHRLRPFACCHAAS